VGVAHAFPRGRNCRAAPSQVEGFPGRGVKNGASRSWPRPSKGRANNNRPAPQVRPRRGPPCTMCDAPPRCVAHTCSMTQITFAHLCDWENLLWAYYRASKGKRGHPNVAAFEYALEDNLLALQAELHSRAYRPGAYVSFVIHEPKRRLISAAPFRDRVVHHALCNLIEPLFERGFIADSYANRVGTLAPALRSGASAGEGTHRALDRCQYFARRYRYALPCDVRQFFPSIDHAILRETLARKLSDPGLLWLVDQILASGVGVLAEEYEMVYFPGDDPSTHLPSKLCGAGGSGQGLWAAARPRGLPIGNLTSQFWANCTLNPFDHFVQRELRCGGPRPPERSGRGYLRYVDDFLLFGDDRAQLWAWKQAITERLARLRLTIHATRAQASARGSARGVRPVQEGIPFLGFVVYPQRRRLKRRKGIAFRRRLRQLAEAYADGQITLEQVTASARGWVNHTRYANTVGLRSAVLGSVRLAAPFPAGRPAS